MQSLTTWHPCLSLAMVAKCWTTGSKMMDLRSSVLIRLRHCRKTWLPLMLQASSSTLPFLSASQISRDTRSVRLSFLINSSSRRTCKALVPWMSIAILKKSFLINSSTCSSCFLEACRNSSWQKKLATWCIISLWNELYSGLKSCLNRSSINFEPLLLYYYCMLWAGCCFDFCCSWS